VSPLAPAETREIPAAAALVPIVTFEELLSESIWTPLTFEKALSVRVPAVERARVSFPPPP
jgi:hypothetical protein